MLGSRTLSKSMVINSGESQNIFLIKIKIEFLPEQRKRQCPCFNGAQAPPKTETFGGTFKILSPKREC